MGYVHDTQMCQLIPPAAIAKTAGTWTPTLASNKVSDVRTAADANFTLLVPVTLPQNSGPNKGAFLKSIDVYYKVGTADLDDLATVQVSKNNLKASGTAVDGSAIAATPDANHDTAAKRKAQGDHTMTYTIDSPVWLTADDMVFMAIVVDAAATSAFSLMGARANFTLRV